MFSISYWTMRWWSKPVVPPPPDPNKIYIDNSRAQFLKLFTEEGMSRSGLSSNIDALIYNKKAFHQVLEDANNELEKSWRTRLLMESTPVGNIVMFYDIFKQGFSYYCDQPIVPYDILNSVAMKYVARFSCMDFFMDEYILEGHGGSKLKAVFVEDGEEKKGEGDKEKKPGCDLDVDLKTAPFAKFKNYSGMAKKNKQPSLTGGSSGRTPVYFRTNYPWLWKVWFRIQYYLVLPVYKISVWSCRFFIEGIFGKTWRVVDDTKKSEDVAAEVKVGNEGEVEKEKIRNKFIYLGRFRNLCILQKPLKKNVFGGGPTKYDSMFAGGGKAVSYKDFKLGVGVGAGAGEVAS